MTKGLHMCNDDYDDYFLDKMNDKSNQQSPKSNHHRIFQAGIDKI